jgi:hypothetical protein
VDAGSATKLEFADDRHTPPQHWLEHVRRGSDRDPLHWIHIKTPTPGAGPASAGTRPVPPTIWRSAALTNDVATGPPPSNGSAIKRVASEHRKGASGGGGKTSQHAADDSTRAGASQPAVDAAAPPMAVALRLSPASTNHAASRGDDEVPEVTASNAAGPKSRNPYSDRRALDPPATPHQSPRLEAGGTVDPSSTKRSAHEVITLPRWAAPMWLPTADTAGTWPDLDGSAADVPVRDPISDRSSSDRRHENQGRSRDSRAISNARRFVSNFDDEAPSSPAGAVGPLESAAAWRDELTDRWPELPERASSSDHSSLESQLRAIAHRRRLEAEQRGTRWSA